MRFTEIIDGQVVESTPEEVATAYANWVNNLASIRQDKSGLQMILGKHPTRRIERLARAALKELGSAEKNAIQVIALIDAGNSTDAELTALGQTVLDHVAVAKTFTDQF